MAIDASKDHYATLGVFPDADLALIKAAHRALAKQYHPDTSDSSEPEANEKFVEIQEAYDVLKSSKKRQEYDALRKAAGNKPGDFSSDTQQDDVEIDIDEAWQVLVQEYPDLDKIYGEFRLMSLALANSFRLTVVEAKDPSSYADIAKKLEKQFLSKYFGRYVAVQDLAKRLLLRGRNTAARRLNKEAKAASNMTSQEREQFVRRFEKRYLGPERKDDKSQKDFSDKGKKASGEQKSEKPASPEQKKRRRSKTEKGKEAGRGFRYLKRAITNVARFSAIGAMLGFGFIFAYYHFSSDDLLSRYIFFSMSQETSQPNGKKVVAPSPSTNQPDTNASKQLNTNSGRKQNYDRLLPEKTTDDMSDTNASKQVNTNPPATAPAQGKKLIYDRILGTGSANEPERIVPRQETPQATANNSREGNLLPLPPPSPSTNQPDTIPKDAAGYNSRGIAYLNKGNLDRAIADYDMAIKLNPKYEYAYFNRGNAYQNKGNFDRAITNYDRAIKLNPKIAVAYYQRGNAHKKIGDLDRAIADYDQAIKLNPKHGNAHYNRGICYQLKRQYKLALADFQQALAHIPSTDERHGMASERIAQVKRRIKGDSSDQ